MTSAVNDREALFLASQASRTAQRDQRRHQQQDIGNDDNDSGRDRGKQRDTFWVSFRLACTALNQQLDDLLPKEEIDDEDGNDLAMEGGGKVSYITAAQRNTAKTKLDSVLSQLRSIQRHCLTPTSSSSSSSEIQNSENDDPNLAILSTPIPELPVADLRLVSEEITKLSSKIDFVRDVVCPKEKFVFRRYRAALLKQQKEQKNRKKDPLNGIGSTVQQDEEFKKDRNIAAQYEGIVEYISDSTVVVQSDGKVCVSHRHSQDDLAGTETEAKKDDKAASSSFLVRNVKNCNVILNGIYKSVHFINIDHCTIDIQTPILKQGSIHVTSCHHTTLHCASNQLRIHDSSHVDFHVFVESGPIIEDCSDMTFYGDYFCNHACPWKDDEERINKFRDVKDFNWLRTLVPSPNFKVVEESSAPCANNFDDGRETNEVMGDSKNDTSSNDTHELAKQLNNVNLETAGNEKMGDEHSGSDDEEDEL